MNKYTMKALEKLDEAEEQVKQGVRKRLNDPIRAQQKKRMPLFVGLFASFVTLALLGLLIVPEDEIAIIQGKGTFTVRDVTLTPLEVRESSYIVTDFGWDGQEEAVLESVELVNDAGETINYYTHHLEMRPWQVQGVEPGQYQLEEIPALEEFTQIEFTANKKEMVLLEFISNIEYEQSSDLALRLSFTVNGEERKQTVDWPTMDTMVVDHLPFIEVVNSLHMTQEEVDAYNAFKEMRDYTVLAHLTPLSIARLYLFAELNGDDALQFAFYTDRKDAVMWDYEEQLTFPVFDRPSLNETAAMIEALSTGTFVETAEDAGYISFTIESMEPHAQFMDNAERGFQLIKNEDGIWQVAFMPLQ